MKNCDNCANYPCSFARECLLTSDAPAHWKPREENKPDTVNHPSHYETGKFECFDVMVEAIGFEEVKGFCLCNAFKYIYRCKSKHETPVEDVKKAIWYLNKFIELEGEKSEQS